MSQAGQSALPTARNLNLLQRIWKARIRYLFLLPAYIPFIIFILYPLLAGLRLSFYDAGVSKANWTFIGLKNFVRLFTSDSAFRLAVQHTLSLVLMVVPAVLLIALFIAVAIHPLTKAPQSFIRMAFYMPAVATGVVLAAAWIGFYSRSGQFNNMLEALGILKLLGLERTAWLKTASTALPALALTMVSQGLGIPVILFLATLNTVPDELYDAAKIDGANALQILWKITLPLLKPTILFVLVVTTIAVFQEFALVQVMTNGGPQNATQTIVLRMYDNAFIFLKFGYGAAMGMILLILVSSVAFFQFRLMGTKID